MNDSTTTVMECLKASLEAASAHNPNDAAQPAAVLWTDRDAQWRPVVPPLRRLMPQLLMLGEYDPEQCTGPAIWLRCMIDGGLKSPEIPKEATPIIYLPGVSRQELGAAEACPDQLKPMVELQYRGTCWTQKNGKDWTVEAFLVSKQGGLGLDLARDASTRQSMLRALAELATEPVRTLQGKRLEAEDFDRLFSDDPTKDMLAWINDPEHIRADWSSERWKAFVARCKADFHTDPVTEGEIVAAERLGRQEGKWASVWRRFAESPALYPGVPERLRAAMPHDLFAKPRESWPRNNEEDETALRSALLEFANLAPRSARERVAELEKTHGERREWIWAELGEAPLAAALEHLAKLANSASSEVGGASPEEMAAVYLDGAWESDAAALDAMAAVRSAADTEAVSRTLNAIYLPWLDSAARHLQALAAKQPLPGDERDLLSARGGQLPGGDISAQDDDETRANAAVDGERLTTPISGGASGDTRVEVGAAMLFADGLRFDVARRLVERLRGNGRSVAASARWAALPSVTATAKPAVSPVTERIKGASPDDEFLPVTAEGGRPLTAHRFRQLLAEAGYQYLRAKDTGDPSGRAWTESGELDKLGHSLQGKLAARIGEQVELLAERIEALLDAGWREVRVVTDHGWLWLPGGLPKVDLPKYLTASRWARCAAIKPGSTVEAPTVPWHWNRDERIAVGPGVACFGAGNEYAHGGLSLQECLIPVLRVAKGAGAADARATICALSWVGLRCRVQVETTLTEHSSGHVARFAVDLRTHVNDADSSVSAERTLDATGAASLLVADDELEGAPAAVVVLDDGGHVVARRSTIIGGEN